MENFVVMLAQHFRTKVLQLPAQLRAVLPGKADFETEDRLDQVVDQFLREIAETSLIVPEPVRTSVYSTKPGPRPKRFNGATKQAAE